MIDASVLISVNAGPFNPMVNGTNCSGGDTINIKLADSTGVIDWFLSVKGTDELSTPPVLSNVNVGTNRVFSPTDVVTFTFPNAAGRAIGFLSIVTNTNPESDQKTFGVYSPMPNTGLRVGFFGEVRESNSTFGWEGKVNETIRQVFVPLGDLGPGSPGETTVTGIQNHPVASTTPDPNNVYIYDGSQWQPQQLTLDPEVIGPAFSVGLSGGGLREVNGWLEFFTAVTQASSGSTLEVSDTSGFQVGDTVFLPTQAQTALVTQVVDPTHIILDSSFNVSINDVVTKTPLLDYSNNYPLTAALLSNNRNATTQNILAASHPFAANTSYLGTTVGSSITFTLTANKGAIQRFASTTFTLTQRIYYGVGSAGGNSESFIEALQNNFLGLGRGGSFTVTAGPGQKIYYAYRVAYGTATFTIGGFEGGFQSPLTISVTNQYGFTENYFLYESENTNLGNTTVVVS